MDNSQYLKQSSRTANSDYNAIANRMSPQKTEDRAKIVDLQHAALGMITESAEFADMLKKHLFYGKNLDEVNLREEIGDLLWTVR